MDYTLTFTAIGKVIQSVTDLNDYQSSLGNDRVSILESILNTSDTLYKDATGFSSFLDSFYNSNNPKVINNYIPKLKSFIKNVLVLDGSSATAYVPQEFIDKMTTDSQTVKAGGLIDTFFQNYMSTTLPSDNAGGETISDTLVS